jgi:hypothetical protein
MDDTEVVSEKSIFLGVSEKSNELPVESEPSPISEK